MLYQAHSWKVPLFSERAGFLPLHFPKSMIEQAFLPSNHTETSTPTPTPTTTPTHGRRRTLWQGGCIQRPTRSAPPFLLHITPSSGTSPRFQAGSRHLTPGGTRLALWQLGQGLDHHSPSHGVDSHQPNAVKQTNSCCYSRTSSRLQWQIS